MVTSLAIKTLIILISSLLGLWSGWLIHALTWRLRTRYRYIIAGLGILGAGISLVFLFQLFSPYLSIPLEWKISIPVGLFGLTLGLAVYHARRRQVRWWADLAAQFTNLLLLILLILLSVRGRDAWITRVYPVYGEDAFDLISTAQSWLAVFLVAGLFIAEITHPIGGSNGKYSE